MGKITRQRVIEDCGRLRLLNYFCFRVCETLSGRYLQTVRSAKRLPLGVAGDHRQSRMAQTNGGHP